jgi:predicted nuclease of predicted toxin-antitoxin system
MAKALDLEVIQHAIKDNRIIVTLDSDFHTLLAVMGASKPSIIRIR